MKNDMFDLDVQVNAVSSTGVTPNSWTLPLPFTLINCITYNTCGCTYNTCSDEK
ncbi:FDLD family class I lanthipeptide [Brevibacillus sp. AG162]|uniref:FDLD family class I lanthipeptide n=1 Tax=Brevibacillus sp. AG162 TaxID=2572910 RepID=UPI001C8948A3